MPETSNKVSERQRPTIGQPRRWTSMNVTYFAQEETVTSREHGWEHYEARCASGKNEQEAHEKLDGDDCVRITGKRRVK